METRKPWLQDARKKHYRTLADWVEELNTMGWDISESTVRNWEASGFLPTSLDYKAINLVAESLRMTANEVLRLQGVNIVAELDGYEIPASAVGLFQKILKADLERLNLIMPFIENHYDELNHLLDQNQPL